LIALLQCFWSKVGKEEARMKWVFPGILILLCLALSVPEAEASVIGISNGPNNRIQIRCEFFDGGFTANSTTLPCSSPAHSLDIPEVGGPISFSGVWNPCPGLGSCVLPSSSLPTLHETVRFVEGPASSVVNGVFDWTLVRSGYNWTISGTYWSDVNIGPATPTLFDVVVDSNLLTPYTVSFAGLDGGPGLQMAVFADGGQPAAPLPEPSSLLLLGSALGGLWFVRR
jgi:hypothetical protein